MTPAATMSSPACMSKPSWVQRRLRRRDALAGDAGQVAAAWLRATSPMFRWAVPARRRCSRRRRRIARVVGIRDILSWDADPARRFAPRDGMMDEAAWRAGLACSAVIGLSFDLMVFPRQLPAAARLAADFPDQQFILNHCGSPIDRDAEGMQAWRDGLRRARPARENVAIKISDLVAYDHDWTLDSLRPVVMHCIECFGTGRAMFAQRLSGRRACMRSFDQVYDSFKTITAGFSAGEQAALFHDNAHAALSLLDERSSAR